MLVKNRRGKCLPIRIMSFFKKKKHSELDYLLGAKCVVTEEIDNFAGSGQVKIGAELWAARSSDDEIYYEVGTLLFVSAIEGVMLVCRSVDK